MRTTIKIFAITLLFTLTSCKTLKISSDIKKNDKEYVKVKGIPFYIQKQVIHQQTAYLYDWLEISLIEEKTEGNKKVSTLLYNGRIEKGQDDSLREIDELISDKEKKKIVSAVKNLNKVNDKNINSCNVFLVNNNWKKAVVIDYDNKYYLNGNMPWFGTATLTQKLNENGTLSESSVTTDSQVDELAAAIIGLATPLASVEVAEIGKEIAEIPSEFTEEAIKEFMNDIYTKENSKPTYKLVIKEKGYLYSFTEEFASNYKPNKPLEFNLNSGNYIRINWPLSTVKKEKSDKKNIDVSATIGLPKD